MRFFILLTCWLVPLSISAQTPNTVTAAATMARQATAATAIFQIQVADTSTSASLDSAIRIGAPGGASADTLTDVRRWRITIRSFYRGPSTTR